MTHDETDEATDPVFEALWTRVIEAWDDDEAHRALLEHALRTEALPDLAARYRVLSGDAERGPLASKKLDAIVVAATNMLAAMRTPDPQKVPLPITLSAFGVSALLLAWLAWALYKR